MEEPSKRLEGRSWQVCVILLAPMLLMLSGFISTPDEKLRPGHGSAIDIDDLIGRVSKLNDKKQHQKALELLRAAVSGRREDPLLRILLVQSFNGFLEDELRRGQVMIINNKHDKKAYTRMASALELLDEKFRAMEILLSGVQHNPKSSELWMHIARLELDAKREWEALDVFREVIRLDKKNSDALNNAAYLIANSGSCSTKELEEAEKLANKARRLDPDNPAYIDTLADVHYRKGNKKIAKNLVLKAIRLLPRNERHKSRLHGLEEEDRLEPQ